MSYLKGACTYKDGWEADVPFVFIDGAWVRANQVCIYKEEQLLITSDNKILVTSDGFRLKGDDEWKTLH